MCYIFNLQIFEIENLFYTIELDFFIFVIVRRALIDVAILKDRDISLYKLCSF